MEIVDNHSVARECIQFLMLFFAISKKPRAPLAEIKLHSRAFDVLFTLQVFPGRELTMSALAEEMGISKQQLTKLINPMEDQGLVTRTHDRNNRRQVRIAITDRGKQVVDGLLENAADSRNGRVHRGGKAGVSRLRRHLPAAFKQAGKRRAGEVTPCWNHHQRKAGAL